MVFYSLVSLLCHFGPICPKYTAACFLLKLSAVKSSMPTMFLFPVSSHLLSYLYLWLSRLLPFQFVISACLYFLPPTCSFCSCFSRLRSLLHTSSLLSWDSTRGALMLSLSAFISSPSFTPVLPFSSSPPVPMVWFSSVNEKKNQVKVCHTSIEMNSVCSSFAGCMHFHQP